MCATSRGSKSIIAVCVFSVYKSGFGESYDIVLYYVIELVHYNIIIEVYTRVNDIRFIEFFRRARLVRLFFFFIITITAFGLLCRVIKPSEHKM